MRQKIETALASRKLVRTGPGVLGSIVSGILQQETLVWWRQSPVYTAPSCLQTLGVHMFVCSQELHRNSVCLHAHTR